MENVLFIVISMLVIVGVAGLVVAFVAFPHRGEDLPGAPWLGETMGRAVDAMPTLDEDEGDALRDLWATRQDDRRAVRQGVPQDVREEAPKHSA